ncbi:hypothetical protein FCM35_KLT05680 [Carex littledalei]|uniref:Uncharacterized protein n=1 Tax=Carex littledalei TaxID=544730 RepID=A0A833V8D9_9POAL|nr:hypothetical protein FCM35_KLT05680 [Carex littledalei]
MARLRRPRNREQSKRQRLDEVRDSGSVVRVSFLAFWDSELGFRFIHCGLGNCLSGVGFSETVVDFVY